MRKKLEPKNMQVSGDNKPKSMILSLDPKIHAWVKRISEADEALTNPKVVNMILAQAAEKDPNEYINQIKKLNAQNELKNLESEAERIEVEQKRLRHLLDS